MFELGARISGCSDVADLLELEGAFERNGIVGLPAHKEEILGAGIFLCDGGHLAVEFERHRDFVGQLLELGNNVESLGVGKVMNAAEQAGRAV